MPFGQKRFEENNELLNKKFDEKQVLICAHRGSWHGNVIQNTWANHYEFAYQDWEHEEGSWRCETDIPALLPANGYAANDEGTTLVIMRWGQANDVDFYIDNLTFYDKDGNSMPVKASAAAEGGEAAPAEEESSEAAEESSEAPAESSEEA